MSISMDAATLKKEADRLCLHRFLWCGSKNANGVNMPSQLGACVLPCVARRPWHPRPPSDGHSPLGTMALTLKDGSFPALAPPPLQPYWRCLRYISCLHFLVRERRPHMSVLGGPLDLGRSIVEIAQAVHALVLKR